jgi:hypothetical protein
VMRVVIGVRDSAVLGVVHSELVPGGGEDGIA